MKKCTAKRVLKWIGITLGALLIIIAAGAAVMFGPFVKAANGIEKLENGLYAMEFAGDYGFDDFLANGGAASDGEVAEYLVSFLSHGFYKAEGNVQPGSFGCSTIYTQDENGTYFFGRNYDWAECETMIVHTKPENGYESVSTCCLDFLGFGDDYAPDGSMMERMQSIAAVYVPLDGMNAKGLVVADLTAGDDEETHQRTGKVNLTTTTAIRLLLDKAADVDEAVALLKQYDMNSSIGISHHLSIADAKGKSIVVEYVKGEMLVSETKVVTNHYLTDCEKRGVGSAQSHERYDTLAAYSGPAGAPQVRDMLESVAQKNYPKTDGSYEKTMWSIVYCPEGRCADFYFAENYDHEYGLILLGKDSFSAGTRTFKPGTHGAELVPEMKVVSEHIFTKSKSNALTSDAFTAFIQEHGITEFYIAGADAAACIKSTCFNIAKSGYTVHVLSDCITSYDKKKLPEMLAYYESKGCSVMTLQEIVDGNGIGR